MPKLCPQLKQNLANLNSLKSELDLELLKLQELFKDLKTDHYKSGEHKVERRELVNKIKLIKIKINLEAEKIEAELPTKSIEVGKEFNLKFKYRGLAKMIEAGNFDWRDDDVNPLNFPDLEEEKNLNKVIRLKAKIFNFEKAISSENILEELDREGYRPATLVELLALAKVDPGLQERFTIVSLGSTWTNIIDSRRAPCIRVYRGERELNTDGLEGAWVTSYNFLAIRKSR
jgi:hypothetical protein